jgi:hypothetical protein
MPSVPRAPNVQVPNGWNLFTVDSGNPSLGYDKVTWSNIPVPPFAVKKVLLLRSPKIDSTTDDNLQIVPLDLRIVGEVDAGVTTFDDYGADDDAPYLDVDKLIIRTDHIMPPRARWNFAGASRAGHSYGGLNPAAIELAPVGFTTDYDLNVADTSSAAFGASASYYILSATALTLVRDTGAATSTKQFLFSTYDTLEKLVDGINKTSTADADWTGNGSLSAQWRAQVLPGQNPQAATSNLLGTIRTITSVVTVTDTTLTKAAGGLSVVAVGTFVTGSGITNSPTPTYVTKIVSDTQLTLNQATTASATVTLNFVQGTGDSITGAINGAYEGYVRVIANSYPGFLYFTKTYLNQFPIEKSSIWLTVGNPESTKCAPNCFSGLGANKHVPPNSAAGISMGGVAIDNGFLTPFSNKRAMIVNTRDTGSGLDKDFHLFITNEASGVIGPIVAGNRCAFAMTPEGWIGADLEGELPLSHDIYLHPVSDAVTGVGDFTYEAPLLIAAAGSDTDTGQMFARVMRGCLWVNYRASGAAPNRQVCYDFSSGHVNAGRAALVRDEPLVSEGRIVAPAGTLYGWSLPLVRSCSQMAEGRRSDGAHLYGWNDANAGSTGDGRIDELETSDTDNGTAIGAALAVPWESYDSSDSIAGREVIFEHSTPAGAIVSGQFNRSLSGDLFTCTPVVTSSLVVSIYRWLLASPARVHSAACWVGWSQASGGAGELRGIELQATTVRDFKPGQAA